MGFDAELNVNAVAREVREFLSFKALSFPQSSAVLIGVLATSIVEQSRGDRETIGALCAAVFSELVDAAEGIEAVRRRNDSRRN